MPAGRPGFFARRKRQKQINKLSVNNGFSKGLTLRQLEIHIAQMQEGREKYMASLSLRSLKDKLSQGP